MAKIKDLIDIKKIVLSVKELQITPPAMLGENFIPIKYNLAFCGMLQLIYKDNEYVINRYYINLGKDIEINGLKIDNFEIVLGPNYEFHVFNIFIGDDIYSFDINGNMINTYYIHQVDDVRMTKSNGDIYWSVDKEIDASFSDEDNNFLNKKRISWGRLLITYSHRIDGRICFYIRLKKEINFLVNPFMSKLMK